MPTEVNWATEKQRRWLVDEIITHRCKNIRYDMPFGYYVEVSLIFPTKTKLKLRNYPPLPLSRDVLPEEVSPHTKRLHFQNGLRNSTAYRMISDVRDVERVQLHVVYLKSLMDVGILVKDIYRVVYFKQSGGFFFTCRQQYYVLVIVEYRRYYSFFFFPFYPFLAWMRSFVLTNTKKRDEAKDDFEKGFFKLIINSQYGKFIENVKKYR